MRRLAAAFLVAAATLLGSAAGALADVDVRVQFGHGGVCVQDAATPLDVILRNTANTAVTVSLTIEATNGVGEDTFRYERSVPLGPGSTRREGFLLAGPSSWMPSGTVRIETEPRTTVRSRTTSGDRGVLTVPFSDVSSQSFSAVGGDERRPVGVLHDDRSTLAAAFDAYVAAQAKPGIPAPTRGPQALSVDPEALRHAPLSLDGLETLVVCDPDATFCADPAHLEGLLDWVALGGRLVVSLGEHAPAFAASPLAAWMPARWAGVERADYAAIHSALPLSPSSSPGWKFEGPRARLSAATGDGAQSLAPGLWEERSFGDGSIALLAFDVRLLAQASPQDEAALRPLSAIVIRDDLPSSWSGKRSWEIQSFDVAGRIGRALQQDAFRPPPLFAVVLGLIAYVLVVGPVDWFVLRRLRKERLTTFTFAGAVAAFTVFAYGVSILLFSSDAVVNRVTFVHYASGGRPGRDVVRVHDLAGYYAPTGGTRTLGYSLPAAILGGNLPGLHSAGGVGASLPVVVRGPDPLRSVAEVEVAFRSQRVVHAVAAGATGRTIDVVRRPGDPAELELTNGLPVDLVEAWLFDAQGRAFRFDAVAGGAVGTAHGATDATNIGWESIAERDSFGMFGRATAGEDASEFRKFLGAVATATITSREHPPTGWESLRRAGILHDAPRPGRALIVAFADESPVALPEGDARGRRHVVLTREIDLP